MNTVILGGEVAEITNHTLTIRTTTESGRVIVKVRCAAELLKGICEDDHVVVLAEVRDRFTRVGGSIAQLTEVTATRIERYRESMGYTTAEILDALRVKW